MPKEKQSHGYGPNHALTMETPHDFAVRISLASTIDPEITKGMLLPHKYNKKGWWVEVPNLPDKQYFLRIIKNLIDEAEKTVHPEVMAQNITTRFVPDIFLRDPASRRVTEASGQTVGLAASQQDFQTTLIEVSLSALKQVSSQQRRHWIYFAARTIFHEVFELDYNVRMRQGQIPTSPRVSEFDRNYGNAPHEQYATSKAEELIQEVLRDAPIEFRQMTFGMREEKEIKLQTTSINQMASAILRFLAGKAL